MNNNDKVEELNANPNSDKESISVVLNPRQELFCQLYIGDRECFGNATKAYAKAYDIEDNDSTLRASASIEMRFPYIKKRISELLEEYINDTVVDIELASVIKQNKELSSKVAAIREYNKLKQRIVEKTDITSGGKPIPILTLNKNVLCNNSDSQDMPTDQEN